MNGQFGPWHSLADLKHADENTMRCVKELMERLPDIGRQIVSKQVITLPTDGVLFEAEFANCPSCDPEKQAEIHIELERAKSEARKCCLEAELLALEVRRRKQLLQSGQLNGTYASPMQAEAESVDAEPVAAER